MQGKARGGSLFTFWLYRVYVKFLCLQTHSLHWAPSTVHLLEGQVPAGFTYNTSVLHNWKREIQNVRWSMCCWYILDFKVIWHSWAYWWLLLLLIKVSLLWLWQQSALLVTIRHRSPYYSPNKHTCIQKLFSSVKKKKLTHFLSLIHTESHGVTFSTILTKSTPGFEPGITTSLLSKTAVLLAH